MSAELNADGADPTGAEPLMPETIRHRSRPNRRDQPAGTDTAAGSPRRAASACARLSREAISTAARSAPAIAKPGGRAIQRAPALPSEADFSRAVGWHEHVVEAAGLGNFRRHLAAVPAGVRADPPPGEP